MSDNDKGKLGSRPNKDLLTEGELLFVCHWRGNASKAAQLAGFKQVPSVAAARLMKKPRVKEAILLKQRLLIEESVRQGGTLETPDGSQAAS